MQECEASIQVPDLSLTTLEYNGNMDVNKSLVVTNPIRCTDAKGSIKFKAWCRMSKTHRMFSIDDFDNIFDLYVVVLGVECHSVPAISLLCDSCMLQMNHLQIDTIFGFVSQLFATYHASKLFIKHRGT